MRSGDSTRVDDRDKLLASLMQNAEGRDADAILRELETFDREAEAIGFLESPLHFELDSGHLALTRCASTECYANQDGEDTAPDDVPETVGCYRLIRLVGHGGFGRVFEAHHCDRPGERVALKMIEPRLLNAVDRLEIEKLVLQQLNHPNLVSIVDSGKSETGETYLVMRFVDGMRMDKYVSKRQLDFADIARLFACIADALEYAHARDIVHRDLKPGNILVTADGVPVVVDFGLAKRLRLVGESTLTATGGLLGTLGFLAPEQASPDRREITRAVDIYGLGATLYFVLTGQAPFERENFLRSLQQLQSQKPIEPRQINAAVPRNLERICLRCLEKLPHDRYPSMSDFAADLRRCAEGKRLIRRYPQLHRIVWSWSKSQPVTAGLTCALTVSIICGLVVSTVLWQRAVQRERDTRQLLYTARQILNQGDRTADKMLVQTSGSLAYQRKRLLQSVAFFNDLVGRFPDDHDLLYESAVSWFRLGKVNFKLGLLADAFGAYQTAFRRFSTLARNQHDDELQFDVVHALLGLDHAADGLDPHYRRQNPVGNYLGQAIPILEQLVEKHPDDVNYLDALACTLCLSGGRIADEDPIDARAQVLKAFDIANRLKARFPEPCLQWKHVGGAAQNLSVISEYLGDLDAADRWLKIAIEETDQFLQSPNLDPGDLTVRISYLNMGFRLARLRNDQQQADDYYQQLEAFVNECLAKYPEYVAFQKAREALPGYSTNPCSLADTPDNIHSFTPPITHPPSFN